METIYGGEPELELAVHWFYERVRTDPERSSFFDGTDLRTRTSPRVALPLQALGAHAQSRIGRRPFDPVTRHIVGTLREVAVPNPVISSIVERLAPLGEQIVNTPSRSAAAAD